MTPQDLAGIMKRAREWGEATPSPDAVVWTRDQLAEAYLLAGMDRRALLGLLRETREAGNAALTDFIYAHGSDFDPAEWPGMAALRAALAEP